LLDQETAPNPSAPSSPTASGHPSLTRNRPGLQWGLRATLVVACLGVLAWSWRDSEMNPGLLIDRAPRAQEYIFGREMEPQARTDARLQAERLTDLTIQREVENQLRRDLGVGRKDAVPDDFQARLDQATATRLAAIGEDEYERLVRSRETQIVRQARGGYFPPETGRENLQLYWTALLETVAIAVWGTLIALVLAVPAAVFGAHRSMTILVPGSSRQNRLIRTLGIFGTRRMFDICRGFNEFVLALIFVAIVGLGPFAGVLALAFHTFGVLGKVISEAIEAAKVPEIEGISAVGAGPVQTVSYSVIPQIMPYIVSQSLLRFESNVRSASVLGLVGAGGIGFLIDAKLKAYKFTEVATIMIMVIIAVTIIDFVCGRIMKRLV
jgi:phosphonate transport system permease protein